MPFSPGQDSQHSSIISSLAKAQAQAQKSASQSVTIPSKKDKKNGVAKDSGGGAGAVAKAGSKPPDSGKVSPVRPIAATPSPEIQPIPTVSNNDPAGGPVPSTLSPNALSASNTPNTNEWTKNVPAFSSSPGNLISLSDSPPTQPSSYDDRASVSGWNSRDRSTSNGPRNATSPPSSYHRRPLSFQHDAYPTSEEHSPQRFSSMYRRSSIYSQYPQRHVSHVPLPHQPQPHFYGIPDVNLSLPSRVSGSVPGSQGYYCGFDSLYVTGGDYLRPPDTVVVAGYEGGLEICKVSRNGLEIVTYLRGLRGGVYSAKILPWRSAGDGPPGSQLIAVVVHGPVWHSADAGTGELPSISDTTPIARAESTHGSPRTQQRGIYPDSGVAEITHYQTTVEVYSLVTKKLVGSLLCLPKVPLRTPVRSPLFIPPPPGGELAITAEANYLAVSSGTSGEVWLYHRLSVNTEGHASFPCIGKVWTTVSRSPVHEFASHEYPEHEAKLGDARTPPLRARRSLLSLKGRWLTYSPCTPTSQESLRATVPGIDNAMRIPGLNSFTPPQLPMVSCGVDTPGDEFWDRLKRQAAQATFDGIKTLGVYGRDLWNNWTKSSQHQPATGPAAWHSPPHADTAFPPTHGEGLHHVATNSEPTLVSILDLEKLYLSGTASIVPSIIATFKAPLGCSYMSLAPNGLALLTASSKGDVQIVWSLMRVQHTRSSTLGSRNPQELHGIHVRQLAIFTRLTVARIVDVVWTTPHRNQIALITERNTVHFLEIPSAVFAWPPPVRRTEVKAPSRTSDAESETSTTAASVASSAVSAARTFGTMVTPLVSRPRTLSGSSRIPSSITSTFTATAGHGGKALVGGISKSFGAASGAIQHFYHSGENKLHLPQSTAPATVGCVRWLNGNKKDHFLVLVDGTLKMYAIKQVRTKGDRQRVQISNRPMDFKLPLVPDYSLAPAVLQAMDLADEIDTLEKENEAFHDVLSAFPIQRPNIGKDIESSIPEAEIESNAPYQPFHTDPRVGLYVYSPSSQQVSTVSDQLSQAQPIAKQGKLATDDTTTLWVFGQPIEAAKLNVGPIQTDDDLLDSSTADHRALPSSAMERVTTENPEQIVITTRRRKLHSSARTYNDVHGGDEEGFFEDDCEVLDFASQRV